MRFTMYIKNHSAKVNGKRRRLKMKGSYSTGQQQESGG
jgi:hypothetical protein